MVVVDGTDEVSIVLRAFQRAAGSRFVAMSVFAVGVVTAFFAMRRWNGVDAQWPYLYAHGVWHGEPIFRPDWQDANATALTGLPRSPFDFSLYWPASFGVVSLPLAALSFESARIVLLLLFIAGLTAGVWALFGLARPATRWPVRLTVAGLVTLSACAQWCWTPVQVAPLLAGALVACLYGLHRDRPWMALGSVTIVLAVKPTLCIPFVLLLVLHRRLKVLALALGATVALNVVGFLRVGGFDAFADYRAGLASLERRGGTNTPNFWERVSLPRVDWIYLVTGSTGSFGLGRAVALAGGGAIGVFLCLACWRMAKPSLADSGRIMLAGTCLCLIVVYHHHYDLALLIPPLLLTSMLYRELMLSWSRWVTRALVPLALMMALLPVSRLQIAATSVVGDRGNGLVNVCFPIATTLALLASLAMVAEATGGAVGWRTWFTSLRRTPVSKSPQTSLSPRSG